MRNAALAPVALLLLAACYYDYPLADASAAVADDSLVGLWHIRQLDEDIKRADILILPLPRRQYLITLAVEPGDERTIERAQEGPPCLAAARGWGLFQVQYVAYVTEHDGGRLLNLESVCGEAGFAFARYWIRADTARFRIMAGDDEFSSREAVAAIPAKLRDPDTDVVLAYRAAKRTVSLNWPDTTR